MFTTTPVWPAGTTVKQLAATIITATIAGDQLARAELAVFILEHIFLLQL
jgi:hypothetical protein